MVFKIKILLWVILIFLMGYIRDFFFKHLNFRLGYLWFEQERYITKASDILYASFSYYGLYYFKYVLTLIFVGIYAMLCHRLFSFLRQPKAAKNAMFFYLLLTGISFFIFCAGALFGFSHQAYAIARYIIGIVQSPILIALLYFGLIHLDKQSIARQHE